MHRVSRLARAVAVALSLAACSRTTLVPGTRGDGEPSGSGGSGQGGFAQGQGGSGQGGFAQGQGGSGQGGFAQGQGGSGQGGSAQGQGGAGQGGAAQGQGGSGQGGAPPLGEDCLNGIDDDGNGLEDCADPACTKGYACTPEAPVGWQGPLAFYQGNGGSPAPTCDDQAGFGGLALDGYDGVSGAVATCATCTCGSPKGVACNVATAQLYGAAQCMGGAGQLTIAGNVCIAFVSMTDPQSVRWGAAPAAGGVCLAKPVGDVVVPPLAWQKRARACSPDALGAGCGAGVCAPRPAAPFGARLCIAQSGDVACPGGGYSQRSVYYAGADDTRGCTECDCGPPTGMTCTGKLDLATDNACSADVTTLNTPSQCAPLSPDPTPPPQPSVYQTLRSMFYTPGVSQGGGCAPVPSVPGGTVTAVDPITVCCAP